MAVGYECDILHARSTLFLPEALHRGAYVAMGDSSADSHAGGDGTTLQPQGRNTYPRSTLILGGRRLLWLGRDIPATSAILRHSTHILHIGFCTSQKGNKTQDSGSRVFLGCSGDICSNNNQPNTIRHKFNSHSSVCDNNHRYGLLGDIPATRTQRVVHRGSYAVLFLGWSDSIWFCRRDTSRNAVDNDNILRCTIHLRPAGSKSQQDFKLT